MPNLSIEKDPKKNKEELTWNPWAQNKPVSGLSPYQQAQLNALNSNLEPKASDQSDSINRNPAFETQNDNQQHNSIVSDQTTVGNMNGGNRNAIASALNSQATEKRQEPHGRRGIFGRKLVEFPDAVLDWISDGSKSKKQESLVQKEQVVSLDHSHSGVLGWRSVAQNVQYNEAYAKQYWQNESWRELWIVLAERESKEKLSLKNVLRSETGLELPEFSKEQLRQALEKVVRDVNDKTHKKVFKKALKTVAIFPAGLLLAESSSFFGTIGLEYLGAGVLIAGGIAMVTGLIKSVSLMDKVAQWEPQFKKESTTPEEEKVLNAIEQQFNQHEVWEARETALFEAQEEAQQYWGILQKKIIQDWCHTSKEVEQRVLSFMRFLQQHEVNEEKRLQLALQCWDLFGANSINRDFKL